MHPEFDFKRIVPDAAETAVAPTFVPLAALMLAGALVPCGAALAQDVDQDDFVGHIMAEHDQFVSLLETAYNTIAEFVHGQTTIGALKRLCADINAALPAVNPTAGGAA